MKNLKLLLALSFLYLMLPLQSQETVSQPVQYDHISFGLGMGLDFGGLGGNILLYPQKNIGLFAGGGYAFAGFGYNIGVKLRLVSTKKFTRFSPSFLAMYGYNAAVYIANLTELNKFFYGPTFGLGLDFLLNQDKKGYFYVALLIPIRDPAAYDYIDYLKSDYGAEFKTPLMPFAFSVGYRIVLN